MTWRYLVNPTSAAPPQPFRVNLRAILLVSASLRQRGSGASQVRRWSEACSPVAMSHRGACGNLQPVARRLASASRRAGQRREPDKHDVRLTNHQPLRPKDLRRFTTVSRSTSVTSSCSPLRGIGPGGGPYWVTLVGAGGTTAGVQQLVELFTNHGVPTAERDIRELLDFAYRTWT
jgi:hypothetical protein